jgi:hypothetical protein
MDRIVAKLNPDGILLYFDFIQEGGNVKLSTQDLMDFVDTDIPFYYNGKKMNLNDYLGESRCFAARQSGHSF